MSKKDEKDCPFELLNVIDSPEPVFRKAIIKEFISIEKKMAEFMSSVRRIEVENAAIIAFLFGIFILTLKAALGF